MRNNREYVICQHATNFMRMQYPHTIWRWDMAGLNLSKAQAGMNKAIQCGRGWCDLFIAEPRGIFSGAFFEVKKEGTNLKKKDGLWAIDHIGEQAQMIEALTRNGYKAKFSIGLDELIIDINYYKSLPLTKQL